MRRVGLALGVAAAVALMAAVSVGPVVTSIVERRARPWGVEVSIQRARLGLGAIRLSGVRVHAPDVPGVDVTLAQVDVFPSLLLSPRRIEVHGGLVRLGGSYEELERRIEAFRQARGVRSADESRRTSGAASPSIVVDGIDVSWPHPFDRGDASDAADASGAAEAWGVRYERDQDGRELLAVDLLRISAGGTRAEMARGRVVLGRWGERRVLVETSAEKLFATIDLDALVGRVAARESPPHAGAGAPARGPRPLPPSPDGADVSSQRGPKIREKIRSVVARMAAFLPSSGKVELPRAAFEVRRAGEALNFGPATVVVARDAEHVRVSLTSGSGEGKAPLELDVAAPIDAGPVDLALAGGPLPLAALGVREGDMGLEEVDRAEFEVQGRARLEADGRSLSLSGHTRISDLSLREPKLAPDAVRGLRITLGGDVALTLDGSLVTLTGVEIGVGKVKVMTRGTLAREGGHAKVDVHLEVPLAACSDMLAGTPPALVPLLSGLEMSGTFALGGELSLDTRKPGDVRVDFSVANGCRITKVPEALSPERFRRPWTRAVLGADGAPTTTESGPGSPGWVSLFDVSPYVATAVVVCEDAHFYTHDGFDGKSIEDSIRDDLRAGKFVRGGSTVSMQLAKNLYLGREKTLSRKLEEAVLTLLLEQRLGKDGILELYLNVVELGPGIYGIGPAAAHYFRATPKDLSLAQALYLVSLLPNPKAHHFAEGGVLTPAWAEYLRHLMRIAHKIHRVTDAELEAGLAETVRFGASAGATPEPGSREPGGEGSAAPEILDMAPRDDSGDLEGP